jgi:uncharacterized glyoxalase superfamily protein PhnB
MRLHVPVPILRIFDEQVALTHYRDFLGFSVDWTHRFGDDFPTFMQISRGDCIFHLSEHHGDACPGAHLRIRVDGLDELHQSLSDRNYKYAKPDIEDTPWGDREMRVADPFGNRLTFHAPKADD